MVCNIVACLVHSPARQILRVSVPPPPQKKKLWGGSKNFDSGGDVDFAIGWGRGHGI